MLTIHKILSLLLMIRNKWFLIDKKYHKNLNIKNKMKIIDNRFRSIKQLPLKIIGHLIFMVIICINNNKNPINSQLTIKINNLNNNLTTIKDSQIQITVKIVTIKIKWVVIIKWVVLNILLMIRFKINKKIYKCPKIMDKIMVKISYRAKHKIIKFHNRIIKL